MAQRVVVRVEIDGCGEASKDRLVLQMMWPHASAVKKQFVQDSVWRLSVPGLPSRYVRLSDGEHSLRTLLEKYTFTDASGCAYSMHPNQQIADNWAHNAQKIGAPSVDTQAVYAALKKKRDRSVRWLTADAAEVRRYVQSPESPEIDRCHFNTKGIAQLSATSGICWYSSMWFAILSPPKLRAHIYSHLEQRSKKCEHCAYLLRHLPKILNSQTESEAVRRYLYEALSIGNCPDQAPEEDGENGGSMATLVCGAIRIPMRVALAPWLKPADVPIKDAKGREAALPPVPGENERDILMVRTYRTRWAASETLAWGGRRYILMSMLIGSEHCGHQIGVARSCEDDTWAISDSDGIRKGVLPMCFRKPTGTKWATLAPKMVPYSNATSESEFCDMAPGGRHPLQTLHDTLKAQGLDAIARRIETSGKDLINVDYIYLEA